MSLRYKRMKLKSGRSRFRVRDKKGRFVRWEDIEPKLEDYFEEEMEEEEKYKIIEWMLNFRTTEGKGNQVRDWEVRIQVPDGENEHDILLLAEDILMDLTNENMVYSSKITWNKKGKDVIEYITTPYRRWKVTDNTRPRYTYPVEGWGSLDE